jgi:hypothetical protein
MELKIAIIPLVLQENPRDKLAPNPRNSWIGKSASFLMSIPHSPLSKFILQKTYTSCEIRSCYKGARTCKMRAAQLFRPGFHAIVGIPPVVGSLLLLASLQLLAYLLLLRLLLLLVILLLMSP